MNLSVSSKLQQLHYSYSDDELACKICLTVYSQRSYGLRPRTLQCNHTFCESCLQQLINDGRRQRKGQAEWSAGTVKCPLCKYRTCLGPTSIQGLPVNSAAIKHSGRTQMSGFRDYGLQLHDLKPRSASASAGSGVSGKRKPKIHFMSCGTTGNRVMAQRWENFHPPPQDDDDDIWARSLSHRRHLRFADDDPAAPVNEHGYRSGLSPRHGCEDESDGVFEDLTPTAVQVGQLGHYSEAPDDHPGSFHSPSSIDCAYDGRLVVVDAESETVLIFSRIGSYSSSFRVVGARAACFIANAAAAGGGAESLAVATNSGVSICEMTGRVDKHMPVGSDVVAVAPLRHDGGVFVAAHRNRITICDRYKPTAILRTVSAVRPLNAPIGHPGMKFSDIRALATTATPRLYMVDAAAVLAVDVETATLLQSISPADTRLLRQPSAITVDLITGSTLVCDSSTRRVMQFNADGGFERCVAVLADDGSRCVAMAAGPRDPDDHQLIYIVCCRPGFAEVRMYQI